MTTRIKISFLDVPTQESEAEDLTPDSSFQFSEKYTEKHKEGGLFVLKINGPVQNYPQGMYFEDFIAISNELSIMFQNQTYTYAIGGDLEFHIQPIGPANEFPVALNKPVPNQNYPLKGVIFYTDSDQNTAKPRFLKTITFKLKDLWNETKKCLEKEGLSAKEMKIGHLLDNPSDVSFFKENELKFQDFGPFEVTRIWVKSIDYVRYKIGDGVSEVEYIDSRVPRLLFKRSMAMLESIKDRTPEIRKNARSLGYVSLNHGVPVHLLPKLLANVDINRIERIGIPFNRHTEYLDALKEDEGIKFVLDNLLHMLDKDSSEADLRALLWDHLLQRLLFAGDEPREDLKFDFFSEYQLSTFLKAKGRADLAAVLKAFFPIPFLIIEIGKLKPEPTLDHKDHSKLLTMCSQSCLEMYHAAREMGGRVDPLKIKVFGLWIGYSEVRCCVAHPVETFNSETGQQEVSIHISFPPEWCFDLLAPGRDCVGATCCSAVSDNTGVKAFKVDGDSAHIPSMIPRDHSLPLLPTIGHFHELMEIAQATAARQNPLAPAGSTEINYKALAKVCVFLNCARNWCAEMAEDINGILPPSHSMGSSSAAASSSSNRPIMIPSSSGKNLLEPAPAATAAKAIPSSPIDKKSKISALVPEDAFEITKSKTHETFIYLNAGLVLPFLPRLYSVKAAKTGPDQETFIFERMEKLVDSDKVFCKFLRKDELALEAITFAVHTLFELHLIHSELGYVHSDISPNNVMFSPAMKIWKINDFNQSLPIEESLERVRTGGTSGYRAPEVERTGIFTPAGDVYALGCVLEKIFYQMLLRPQRLGKWSREIKKFRSICQLMLKEDPDERISTREALKQYFRMFLKFRRVPHHFEIYGADLIFPLVEQEFRLDTFDAKDDDDDSYFDDEDISRPVFLDFSVFSTFGPVPAKTPTVYFRQEEKEKDTEEEFGSDMDTENVSDSSQNVSSDPSDSKKPKFN